MGFFSKKSADTLAVPEGNVNPKSEASTVVPSQNVSSTDLEKHSQPENTLEEKTSRDGSVEREKSVETDTALQSTHEQMGMALVNPSTKATDASSVDAQEEKAHVQDATGSEDDEMVYPGGLKLFLITLALCLSVFLVALDNTIIATAIPKITDHFKSLGDIGWYGSSYLLTTCALQLFFGK